MQLKPVELVGLGGGGETSCKRCRDTESSSWFTWRKRGMQGLQRHFRTREQIEMWVARHWQDTRITLRFLILGRWGEDEMGHEHGWLGV